MKNGSSLRRALVALFAIVASCAANATDYYWTGSNNDGLWSTTNNWAMDVERTIVATNSPATGERATCHFDVPAAGLVVTQDTGARIVISNLIVTTSSTDPVEMKIVSPAQGSEFEFSPGGQITVGANATLVLNTDMSSSGSRETIEKFGDGTLAFDLVFASPVGPRPVVVYAGRVVVLSTSKDVRHAVRLAGTDAAHPPVYENQRNGGLYKSLEAPGVGCIQLNGTTMNVGDKVDSVLKVTTAYTIPKVSDSGTLSFANEHSYMLATNQPSYNIALDRADVTYAPETVIGMQFEDANDPRRDVVGIGSRLVDIGEPQVVNDEVRGSVLSLDGSSGFKGPDANNGLAEFNPSAGFTLAMWLKPASDCNGSARVFYFGDGSKHASAVALRLEAGNKIRYTHRSGYVDFSVPNVLGNWHHVAVTYNGNRSYSFYLDGNPVALTWSAEMTADLDTGNKNFFLGCFADETWFGTGTTPYKGLVDDFFIANRQLSESEISDIYSNGITAYSEQLTLQAVSAKAAGALFLPASASVKTISGVALAGGVEMTKPGTTLTVGSGSGATNTVFQGTIAGTNATLVKSGGDYALTLKGAVKGVTNVVVDAGTLTLSRPGSPRGGLVCRYSFDDASDFGRDDGPAGLKMSPQDPGTPTAIAGVSNGAINFPEVENGYVYFTADPAGRPSNFPSGNDSFTISTWICPTTKACTTGSVICCWGGGGKGKMAMIRLNGTTSIMFVSVGTGYNISVSVPKMDDGKWHHLVATYDGTTNTKKFYFDGELKGEATIAGGIDVNTAGYDIEIGHTTASTSNASKRYSGGMDELMVFDYAWSAEEVEAEFGSRPVPAPVVRWTFDGDDPLADTTGNENFTLSQFKKDDGVPNVTFESGDFICGKAARFTKTSGCLRCLADGLLPSGKANVTLVVRYRPDMTQISDNYSRVAGWGGASQTELFALGTEKAEYGSVRAMLSDFNGAVPNNGTVDRTALGSDHTRWYTVALTFDKTTLQIYVDGKWVKSQSSNVAYNLVGGRASIGSSYAGTRDFYGLVDDVQIYNEALTAAQVRMVADSLEASKGKVTTDAAVPAGVLRDAPDVTVASGATLKVASTENVGNISGDGNIEIASMGRLNVSGVCNFSGTVTGKGLVGFADNAVLDFGDGSAPLLDVDHPIALGTNVKVDSTVRGGKYLIAKASSFIDVENLESWKALIPSTRAYKFVVAQTGKELYLVVQSGMAILVR